MTMFLFLACAEGEVEQPLYSGEWEAPQREQLSDLPLPVDEDGNTVLVATPSGLSLVFDPDDRSPVSAGGECAGLLMACLDPLRNVLGCLQNVSVCGSDHPSGTDPFCCPSACEGRYVELRKEGLEEADALADALFAPGSCIPGLDETVDGERR